MTSEARFGGSGDEERTTELETVSQETLTFLLEGIRSRCLTGFLATMGSGGVSFKDVQHNGKPIGLDLYYYGDNDGQMTPDVDGSLQQDTSGRYTYLSPGMYRDNYLRATIFKTEKADESEPDGKKFLTIYKIIKSAEGLDVDKRVHPLELPILLKRGDQLVVDEDGPPLISAQARQASRQQEDELGLSSVSEGEAADLIELLRTI